MGEREQAYRHAVEQSLWQFYSQVKQGKGEERERARIQGMLRAGTLLGVIDNSDARRMMESTHFKVFNQTIEQRLSRRTTLRKALKDSEYEFLDEPTAVREGLVPEG